MAGCLKTVTHAIISPTWVILGVFSSDADLRILLVGKTGCGKSATANTIIGEVKFKESPSASSCTKTCQVEKGKKFDRDLLLVDSPGLFDTLGNNDIDTAIKYIAIFLAPGPHVIIYVVSAHGRFTEEEIKITTTLKKKFGPGLEDHLIILITKTDAWKKRGKVNMTIQQFMLSLPEDAQSMLTKRVCQYRSIAFNNNLEGEAADNQVLALFKMIDEVKAWNQGSYYSDAHFQEAQSDLIKRASKCMNENPRMSWEEAQLLARQKAIEKVETSWCTIL